MGGGGGHLTKKHVDCSKLFILASSSISYYNFFFLCVEINLISLAVIVKELITFLKIFFWEYLKYLKIKIFFY